MGNASRKTAQRLAETSSGATGIGSPARRRGRSRTGIVLSGIVLVGVMAVPSGAQDTTTTAPTSSTVASTDTTSAPTTAAPTTEAPTTAPAGSDTTAPPAGADTTAPPPAAPTTLSAADQQAKAAAAGKLNAALAADTEIAAGLRAINEVAQATQSKVDQAQRRLEAARTAMETASAELETSSAQQAQVELQLANKAVEGFKSGLEEAPSVFFTDRSMNQTIRQTQLLHQANKGTAELLEELRNLKEDQRVAQAEANQAAVDAEALQAELTVELAALQEQQRVQLSLKREAESRINKWESALTAYAAEDRQIQSLISGSSPTTVVVAAPRAPSAYGMQWPVQGPVTSGYGYRVHPVYGTRKLHSGLDVSAPQGTPIVSATKGTVIFAGWRGGYGNTVIVDNGEGLSTLYAHMSRISIAEGAAVERGDGLGLVGATGTATGNHLHFEVRVNGETTDPRPYLP